MKRWKKAVSAGLALGLLITGAGQTPGMYPQTVYASETGTLQNGSLTKNADGWTFGGDTNKYGYGFDDGYLSVWNEEEAQFSISQTIEQVTEGSYYANLAIVGKGNQGASESKDSLTLTLKDETLDTETSVKLACDGWDNWGNLKATDALSFQNGDTVTITISGKLEAGEWYGIKNVSLAEQTQAVEAPITVQKVEGLSKDFINGVDVSSYLSLVESGVKYYDENGNESNLFDIMEQAGINYVRLRVWNCPFPLDKDGNYKYVGEDGTTEYAAAEVVKEEKDSYGFKHFYLADGTEVYRETYGAGICDVDTAAVIGKIATEHNMKVLIDFHYSDFWADPKKKSVPKAWEGMSVEEKADALETFTEESLKTITDAGVDVGMVQIGNEINNGMAGEKDSANVYTLLKSGSKAVRKVAQDLGKEILIAVHFTDPQSEGYQYKRATELDAAGVDYDVFATSFYPFWHGTADTLKASLQSIADDFNKKVMVAEISYAWTMEDGDGYGNIVNEGAGDQDYNYSIDMEGQANAVRDAIAAISSIGENGIGTFYWEPAWIPVQKYDASAENAADVLASNEKKWKLYGSGWGTLFANEYDPEIVDDRNGGTWDNQAFFDFDGHVLPSINVYKWVYTGAEGPTKVSTVDTCTYSMNYQETPDLPKTVTVNLNDGRKLEASVTWNADEAAALKIAEFGEYTVNGTVGEFSYETRGETVTIPAGSWTTSCVVKVEGTNYITNPSFETGNADGWTLTNYLEGDAGSPSIDKSSANAKSGTYYFKGWSEDKIDFALDQTLVRADIPNGNYTLFAYYQGTGAGTVADDTALYAILTYKDGSTKTYRGAVEIHNVWKDFYQAKVKDIPVDDSVVSIQVGTRLSCSAKDATGVWTVVDEFGFMKAGELSSDSSNGTDSGSNSGSVSDDSSVKEPDTKDEDSNSTQTVVKKGDTLTKGDTVYTVSSTAKKTVVYTKAKKSAKVTVPATVTANGVTYQVTEIAAGAFKNNTDVTSVVIGSNVTKIGKNAFSGAKNVKTITIKSDKLTKKAVKNALKGSSVKKIQLKGNAKKMYKKYVTYFTKANCGKSVTVKK